MSTANHHYFASFGLGWATAATEDEAIRKLMHTGYFREEVKRMTLAAQKRGEAGAYCWTCKVHVPESTKYAINFYSPQGVEKSEGRDHYITYITAKEMAYLTPKGQED